MLLIRELRNSRLSYLNSLASQIRRGCQHLNIAIVHRQTNVEDQQDKEMLSGWIGWGKVKQIQSRYRRKSASFWNLFSAMSVRWSRQTFHIFIYSNWVILGIFSYYLRYNIAKNVNINNLTVIGMSKYVINSRLIFFTIQNIE